MDLPYPKAPPSVPADLTAPTPAYKRQAALAVAGVVLFFVFYFGLTAWFGYVAVRALRTMQTQPLASLLVAGGAAFLFTVMVKGLLFRKRTPRDRLVEVTAEEQPGLFAFVHAVAEEVGAPKPAHIYLTPDVNAAVFLDVGIWNLLFPSRKNLIVGLGLVNQLSLDEFKAVMAHEFGHFAQRSMGIGQWVYVVHGFVGDLITRRDILDKGLHFLSLIDLRVAWIGWILRLVVWALRAVVDQVFRVLLLLSRALARQMEFQADLVSVKVAGSDSLVHALHRLGAADRGLAAAEQFALQEAGRGGRIADLFALQERFVERYRETHALADHGVTPPRPATDTDRRAHRVFSREVADTPAMWSTHPSNVDREEGCKARYFPSTLDERSAWCLFGGAPELRHRMTQHFLTVAGAMARDGSALQDVPLQVSLDAVDETFARPALDRRYGGLYTTTRLTRGLGEAMVAAEVPSDPPHDVPALLAAHEALFDEALAEAVDRFFALQDEHTRLRLLARGVLEAPGGLLVHRGRRIDRSDLEDVTDEVDREFREVRQDLVERARRARGLALAGARTLDAEHASAWSGTLNGLHAVLRYAESESERLADAVGYFENALAVVLADGKISSGEMVRLREVGAVLAEALRRAYEQRDDVVIGDALSARVSATGKSWSELLGEELTIWAPSDADLQAGWIEAAMDWAMFYLRALDALATAALDLLIETEELVLARLRSGTDAGDAPAPVHAPPVEIFGFDDGRPRQERLGLWDRFQLAEGWVGGGLRFAASFGLLASVFVAPLLLDAGDDRTLYIYNGLPETVRVEVGEVEVQLPSLGSGQVEVPPEGVAIAARVEDGPTIEDFHTGSIADMRAALYNVAGAAAIETYPVEYGSPLYVPDGQLRAERLFDCNGDHIFQTPPDQVRGRGASYRMVVEAVRDPFGLMAHDPAIAEQVGQVQVSFSDVNTPRLGGWLMVVPEEQALTRIDREQAAANHPRWAFLRRRVMSPSAWRDRCETTDDRYERMLCAPPADAAQVAEQADDPWLHLVAARRAIIDDDPQAALASLRRAESLGGHSEVFYDLWEARLLRLLGRSEEAMHLPVRSGMYAFVQALETRAPTIANRAAGIWAREDHALDDRMLREAEVAADADALALGAASVGAPEAWAVSLARTQLPVRRRAAAIAAWAVAVRVGDDALRDRAQGWHRAAGGRLDLGQLDIDTLTANPASLDDWQPPPSGMADQSVRRLLGVLLLGDDAPAEWRTFVEASLFAFERPALR